jgi:hypothetical protein
MVQGIAMHCLLVSLATLSRIACDTVAAMQCSLVSLATKSLIARDTVAASSREALLDDVVAAKKAVAAATVILSTLAKV